MPKNATADRARYARWIEQPENKEKTRARLREAQAFKRTAERLAAESRGAEYAREWRKENARKLKADRVAKKYQISLEDYEVLTRRPCEICGKTPPDVVIRCDHDHRTGKIRGPLCNGCNLTIGHAREDVEILQRAIAYLTKHRST